LLHIFGRTAPSPEITRLSADTISYGVGKAAEALAAIILIPILTRMLSPAELGLWDISMTFMVLTATVASLGLEPALAAFYFHTQHLDERKAIASSAVQLRLISSLLIAAAVFAGAPAISKIIFATGAHAGLVRLVAGILFCFLFTSIIKQLFRMDFSPAKFNIVAVGNSILYIILAALLVGTMGVSGVLFGALGAGICFVLVGSLLARGLLSFHFSTFELKGMLAFGIPLLPSLLAYWVIDFSDRYFLTHMASLEQVGIYSVGAKISSIVILFVTSFQMAWAPVALSIQHQPDARKKYAQGMTFFLVASLAAAAAVAIFGKFILVILAQPKYYEAHKVVPPLVLATTAYGAFLIMNISLILTKKTVYTSIAIGAGALLNLLLNFLLIPKFQMMGAAVATLISYLAAGSLLYLFAQRQYSIPYEFSKIIKIAALGAGAIAAGALIQFEASLLLDILFRLALVTGLLVALIRVFLSQQDTAR